MNGILEVDGLVKRYPAFTLDNVSFSVKSGSITGFIGRNGAGKTTTIKALLNLVHPDAGSISYFGMDFNDNEKAVKQRIGYACGGVSYYPQKKLSEITAVTKSFYDNFDSDAYNRYLTAFKLDENKRVKELSEGMKVKYSLALALSHKAELLILDEPTSGLDPISRDEILRIFIKLAEIGVSVLFSTHITSDLDKCADSIVYIKNGSIIGAGEKNEFIEKMGGGTFEEIMLKNEREEIVL